MMLHLYLAVEVHDDAIGCALDAGAVLAGYQLQPQARVRLDRSGHLFCLLQG